MFRSGTGMFSKGRFTQRTITLTSHLLLWQTVPYKQSVSAIHASPHTPPAKHVKGYGQSSWLAEQACRHTPWTQTSLYPHCDDGPHAVSDKWIVRFFIAFWNLTRAEEKCIRERRHFFINHVSKPLMKIRKHY